MKRTLAITAAGALALSLAACSADFTVDGMDAYRTRGTESVTAPDTMYNGSTSGTNGTGMNAGASAGSDTGMFDITGANGGPGMNGGSGLGTGSVAGAVNRATGSVAGAMNRAGGGNSAGSVYTATNNGGYTAQEKREAESRYWQMLENGRVHDTDGYLLDGENAHYRTF